MCGKGDQVGYYVYDHNHHIQMAARTADGQMCILSRGEADSESIAGQDQRRRRGGVTKPSSKVWQPGQSQTWTTALTNSQFNGRNLQKFLTARLSGQAMDDLVVAGASGKGFVILNSHSSTSTSPGWVPRLEVAATVDTVDNPVAILPMRLNVMCSPGFVMLGDNDTAPIAASSQPGVTYHVTGLNDSQSGTCTTPSGAPASSSCTTL